MLVLPSSETPGSRVSAPARSGKYLATSSAIHGWLKLDSNSYFKFVTAQQNSDSEQHSKHFFGDTAALEAYGFHWTVFTQTRHEQDESKVLPHHPTLWDTHTSCPSANRGKTHSPPLPASPWPMPFFNQLPGKYTEDFWGGDHKGMEVGQTKATCPSHASHYTTVDCFLVLSIANTFWWHSCARSVRVPLNSVHSDQTWARWIKGCPKRCRFCLTTRHFGTPTHLAQVPTVARPILHPCLPPHGLCHSSSNFRVPPAPVGAYARV